ncbi:unnamed protein product [Prorocentrum cordatum]|uniref:Uncharacterized protein n=1 Tax=Prorocentrum cordatum TaxID=2364126 RepID=A0ABN9WBW8_9DINO|nr:unnamed protein product [Polarella glacialis]
MTVLEEGIEVETLTLVFSVASCTLKFPDNSGGAGWSLSIGAGGLAELRADDGLGYPSLLHAASVPQSLPVPVCSDPELLASLDGLDACRQAMRDLTEEELRLAMEDTRICRAARGARAGAASGAVRGGAVGRGQDHGAEDERVEVRHEGRGGSLR